MLKFDSGALEGVTMAEFLDAIFLTGVADADGPGRTSEA